VVKMLPEDARYVIETGNAWSWAIHYLHLKNTQCFHIAMGFGAMGWAIGAAPGVAFASAHSPVVCITGDGAYLMSGQEITVAVEYKLPVIYIVLNDQALGMVKHGQQMSRAEQIGAELPAVDFAALAKALGVQAYTVKCWDDLHELSCEQLQPKSGPVLLDIYIDGSQMPPMKSRLDVLQSAKHTLEMSDLHALS